MDRMDGTVAKRNTPVAKRNTPVAEQMPRRLWDIFAAAPDDGYRVNLEVCHRQS